MAKFGKPAIAIVVMGAIIAILLMLFTPRPTSRSSTIDGGTTSAQPASPKP